MIYRAGSLVAGPAFLWPMPLLGMAQLFKNDLRLRKGESEGREPPMPSANSVPAEEWERLDIDVLRRHDLSKLLINLVVNPKSTARSPWAAPNAQDPLQALCCKRSGLYC